MIRSALWSAAAALLLAGGAFAYRFASARVARADCPGRIICPITGEEICSDRCPLETCPAKKDEVPPCCRRPE